MKGNDRRTKKRTSSTGCYRKVIFQARIYFTRLAHLTILLPAIMFCMFLFGGFHFLYNITHCRIHMNTTWSQSIEVGSVSTLGLKGPSCSAHETQDRWLMGLTCEVCQAWLGKNLGLDTHSLGVGSRRKYLEAGKTPTGRIEIVFHTCALPRESIYWVPWPRLSSWFLWTLWRHVEGIEIL